MHKCKKNVHGMQQKQKIQAPNYSAHAWTIIEPTGVPREHEKKQNCKQSCKIQYKKATRVSKGCNKSKQIDKVISIECTGLHYSLLMASGMLCRLALSWDDLIYFCCFRCVPWTLFLYFTLCFTVIFAFLVCFCVLWAPRLARLWSRHEHCSPVPGFCFAFPGH